MPAPPRTPPTFPALLALAATAALSTLLFTRHNDFPYFYHPDERDKIAQVLDRNWRFEHPMLLLQVTRLLLPSQPSGPSEQTVAQVGRTAAALLSAIATAGLAAAAWLWRGPLAAATAALLAALHQQIFELAHYMKEDPALLAGLALTTAALFAFDRLPSLPRAAAVGVGCGLAASGKYIGLACLALAIPSLLRTRKLAHPVVLLAAFALTAAAVNHPMLANPAQLEKSLGKEAALVIEGQRGMTRQIPHTQYWNSFRDNTTPVIWALLALHFARLARAARQRPAAAPLLPAEWAVSLFPVAYALLLSFSPKTNDRYFAPVTALLCLLAASGALDATRLLSRYIRPPLAATLVLAACAGSQLPSLIRCDRAFARDDRRDLALFIRTRLPADATLAADGRVLLPNPDDDRDYVRRLDPLPQKVIPTKRLPDSFPSLDAARARGVTHLVVSESDYGRYLLASLKPRDAFQDRYARHRAFYEELFRDGELLWERPRSEVIYLHPGLRLFRIQRPGTTPPPAHAKKPPLDNPHRSSASASPKTRRLVLPNCTAITSPPAPAALATRQRPLAAV